MTTGPTRAHRDRRDGLAAAALARVTEQRFTFLARLFTRLGFPAGVARQRALLAYSAYPGHTLSTLCQQPDQRPR